MSKDSERFDRTGVKEGNPDQDLTADLLDLAREAALLTGRLLGKIERIRKRGNNRIDFNAYRQDDPSDSGEVPKETDRNDDVDMRERNTLNDSGMSHDAHAEPSGTGFQQIMDVINEARTKEVSPFQEGEAGHPIDDDAPYEDDALNTTTTGSRQSWESGVDDPTDSIDSDLDSTNETEGENGSEGTDPSGEEDEK